MEVDSGAKLTLINANQFKALNIQVLIEYPKILFRSYSADIIPVLECAKVEANYKDKTIKSKLYTVDPKRDTLLGRSWIRSLGINLQKIYAVKSPNIYQCSQQLKS